MEVRDREKERETAACSLSLTYLGIGVVVAGWPRCGGGLWSAAAAGVGSLGDGGGRRSKWRW